MAVYLKEFETQAAYEAAQSGLILPNVSLTVDNSTVHYNPSTPVPPTPVETRLVAKYHVENEGDQITLFYYQGGSGSGSGSGGEVPFSSMEIDGVEQQSVVTEYTFDTIGEHTVKYTLTDPTSIGQNAFSGCTSLTSIDIPDSVISIGQNAFYSCTGLTSCTIGSGVTTIGYDAFNSCDNLTSIDIPDGVTTIGNYAFEYCSGMTSCTLGSGVTSIGMGAFYNCTSLTSIDIPDSVTSIGGLAFDSCSSLISCTIGSGVTTIGGNAFYQCTSLTSIVSNATTAPSIYSDTFRDVKTDGTLTVPSGSSGYDVWMGTGNYYLGLYNWTKVEQ